MLVERIFLGRPANYAIIAVRLNGSFSTSQFIEVLSKLRKKHPLLGTRVIFDLNNYAWLTNEGVPEIPVVEMKLTKEDQWIDIVKKEHKHIFHLKQGPLIRFTLLKDTNSIDLIVNCHHSICDGLSLAYLIRDILVHLTNPNEEIEPILNAAPLNKKSIPFKAKRSILMALLIKTINRFWKKNEIRFSQNDYQNLTKVFWDKNSCEIIAWQLNGSQTSKLIKGCKEEGVTVNTALVTAFLTAQTKILNYNSTNHMRVHMPINIRNRLRDPVGETFGFYAQALILNLDFTLNKLFWELSRYFNNIITTETKKENTIFNLFKVAKLDPSLLDSTYYHKYGIFNNKWSARLLKGMGAHNFIADLSITNIGKLNFPANYGNLSIEALYGPSVYSDLLNFIVGVATIGDKMNLIITFDDKIISEDNVLKIKKCFMDLLGKLCNW